MPCICLCGEEYSYNMGNGKTATMVYLAMLDYLNGRKIRANFKLKGIEYDHLFSLNQTVVKMREGNGETDIDGDLIGDTDSTYIIDELSTWISCYERPNQKNDGLALMNMAKQTRKMDIKLYYTSQTYGKIPKFLRELTHKIYVVSKCHYENGQYVKCEKDDCYQIHYIAIRECINQGDGLIQPKPTKFFRLPVQIFDMYNTYEVVERVFVPTAKKTKYDYAQL